MFVCTVRYSFGMKWGGPQNWSEPVGVGRRESFCPLRESNGSFSDAHAIAYPLYEQRSPGSRTDKRCCLRKDDNVHVKYDC